jgi:hypothetical protein
MARQRSRVDMGVQTDREIKVAARNGENTVPSTQQEQ